MNKRRVVITGLGTINAVGKSPEETWNNLLAGNSGIDFISKFDTEDFASKIAAEIKDYNEADYLDRKAARKMDKYTQYGVIAAKQAMEDAELTDNFDPFKAGVITGVGIGGMLTLEEEMEKLFKKGPKRISPFFIPKMISNIAAAQISINHNLKAACFNAVSACASSNHAIGTAFRTIQYGDADIMLAGGTEAAITPIAVAGFCSMKALSTRNEEPKKACSPFDSKRDGFIMGEGSAMLVLEEYEHAKKRGAKIYAELAGYSATADAFHITAPRSDAEGGIQAITNALNDAGVKPEEVDYFNAHGTSTPLNDKTETLGIKQVFGDHAYKLKISSTKSMTGHTLGAAGAIEALVACKTIETSKVHPTINLEDADPECDLDYVPNKAIDLNVDCVVSNSLGFGGQNSVLVFKKVK